MGLEFFLRTSCKRGYNEGPMTRRYFSWFLVFVLGACAARGPGDSAREFYDPDESRLPAAEVKPYRLKGDCDGFPRIIDVKTAPGLCLGLVDNNSARGNENSSPSIPMRRPRAIMAYGQDLILVDMAGWQQLKGQVFLLKKRDDGKYRRFLLLDFAELPAEKRRLLYMPSTIQLGPDGKVWVGAAGSIIRFDPQVALFKGDASAVYENPRQVENRRIVRSGIEVVLDNLPYKAWGNSRSDSLHPLKPFVFSNDGSALYLGIGASTDNCGSDHRPRDKCAEAEASSDREIEAHAAIYRYRLDANFRPVGDPVLVARGLRNSLAMAVHPQTGELYQGENSRDIRGATHASRLAPADELNIVRDGEHYGWPYCVGFDDVQREYVGGGWNCSSYAAPHLLLPPHGAPLQMLFYTGSKLPAWYLNKLVIPFHGREQFGHRIATFDVGSDGRPTGALLDMVYAWGSAANPAAPLGTPMGIAQAADGSLFIVEDQAKRIVRLSVLPSEGTGLPKAASADQEWIRHHAR